MRRDQVEVFIGQICIGLSRFWIYLLNQNCPNVVRIHVKQFRIYNVHVVLQYLFQEQDISEPSNLYGENTNSDSAEYSPVKKGV